MNMSKNMLFALMAVVGITLSPGCASTPRHDLAKMQGNWVGKELGAGNGECRMTLSGNSLRFQGARRQEWYIGKLTLVAHTRPRRATILIQDCGFPQYVNQTAQAIYKFDGKLLTIAGDEPGNPTVPTAFAPSESTHTRAFVFTRQ